MKHISMNIGPESTRGTPVAPRIDGRPTPTPDQCQNCTAPLGKRELEIGVRYCWDCDNRYGRYSGEAIDKAFREGYWPPA